MRTLTLEDVEIEVIAEQDDCPVRGNALASGDGAEDKAAEDEILARLDAGDVWAWASVQVIVRWGDFAGSDCLGCCTYASEADFRNDGGEGYFSDMCQAALADLNARVADVDAALAELRA